MASNMDAFDKRYATVRHADDVRNNLIEDLLKEVKGLRKTMDRNPFVLVLLDGNCMNVCMFQPITLPCTSTVFITSGPVAKPC